MKREREWGLNKLLEALKSPAKRKIKKEGIHGWKNHKQQAKLSQERDQTPDKTLTLLFIKVSWEGGKSGSRQKERKKNDPSFFYSYVLLPTTKQLKVQIDLASYISYYTLPFVRHLTHNLDRLVYTSIRK